MLVSVKVTFVGEVEIRFMIQTMCVVTILVWLGKPLQYIRVPKGGSLEP